MRIIDHSDTTLLCPTITFLHAVIILTEMWQDEGNHNFNMDEVIYTHCSDNKIYPLIKSPFWPEMSFIVILYTLASMYT